MLHWWAGRFTRFQLPLHSNTKHRLRTRRFMYAITVLVLMRVLYTVLRHELPLIAVLASTCSCRQYYSSRTLGLMQFEVLQFCIKWAGPIKF